MAVWYCFVEIEYTVILRETSNGPLLRHRHYQHPHHRKETPSVPAEQGPSALCDAAVMALHRF